MCNETSGGICKAVRRYAFRGAARNKYEAWPWLVIKRNKGGTSLYESRQ